MGKFKFITYTKLPSLKKMIHNTIFWRPFVPRLLLFFDIMENKTIHSMILFFCHRSFFRSIIGHFFFVRFFQIFFFHFSCQKFKKHNSQGEVDEKNEQHQFLSRHPFLQWQKIHRKLIKSLYSMFLNENFCKVGCLILSKIFCYVTVTQAKSEPQKVTEFSRVFLV